MSSFSLRSVVGAARVIAGRRGFHRGRRALEEEWRPGMPGRNGMAVPVKQNLVVGGIVSSFVGAVYFYTIYQMQKGNSDDFLDELDSELQQQKKV
jgi:hypothetical protein